jgi:hypothetical protein
MDSSLLADRPPRLEPDLMANVNSLAGLMKWLGRDEWRDAFNEILDRHLRPPCVKADISLDELPSLLDEHHSNVLWGCAFEDLLARDLDDGRNIVDDYLKRRGWKESASNKAYMAALRGSLMSLYEISDIVPEESFLAQDLVRGGEPIRVSERLATRSLKPWDRLAARMVRMGARTEMAGGALPFDYNASETLLRTLRQAGKNARKGIAERGKATAANALSDSELLRTSAFVFTNVWLDDALQRILNPIVPSIRNTEGDELIFTTVSYPLNPEVNAETIRRALASTAVLRAGSPTFWNWIEPRKRRSRKPVADVQKFTTTLDDGSLVLGSLELKDNMLIFEANSQQRAERGRALFEPILGRLVGEPSIETRTVEQLMASPPAKSKAASSGLSPAEERAAVREGLDRHYMNVLDEPVPMLSNKTPRQCARTAKGREKLVVWLKYIENQSAKHGVGSPEVNYDLSWLWAELGVASLRR